MANNSTLPATGDVIRDIDKGGVKTQVVTLDLGGSGAESLVAGAVPVTGTFYQTTQPVSAATLPLPSGAATAANQATANTSLATLALETGGNLAAINTKTPALGQALAAASTPVVLTAIQQAALTPPAAITGYATQTTLAAIAGQLPAALDGSGNLKVAIQSGGGSGGTASSFGAAFPATGTAIGFKDSTGANLAAGNLDASGFLKVNVAAGGAGGGAVTNAGTFATQDSQLAAQNSTTSGQVGPLAQGAVTTAAPSYTTAKTSPLSLTTAGALRVDGSAATQPVSIASLPALAAGSAVIGHVIADSGSTTAVTGNVTIVQATGANLHAVVDSGTITTVTTVTTCSTVTNLAQIGGAAVAMGTGVRSAGTQRVTIATDDVVPVTGTVAATQSGTWNVTNVGGTVSLPTGASTAAKQPALGTAGSASADVLTVQGVASMTALKVDGSAVTQPVSGTVTASSPDASASANLTALNQAATLTGLNGRGSILLQLAGTFVGSVVVEYSSDGFATVKTASYLSPTGVVNTAQTAAGFYRYTGISAYAQARARCSAYTSGTIAATLTASAGTDGETVISVIPQNFQVTDNAVANAAAPTRVEGSTNPLSTDLSGNLRAVLSAATGHGTAASAIRVELPTDGTGTVGLVAGTALVGVAIAPPQTGVVYSGTTALTPKFAIITASASGNTSVVALVAAKKIRVLRWQASTGGSVNVKFQSNTTDISGLKTLVAGSLPGGAFCPVGLFETAAGEALNINLSGAVAVSGELAYIEV